MFSVFPAAWLNARPFHYWNRLYEPESGRRNDNYPLGIRYKEERGRVLKRTDIDINPTVLCRGEGKHLQHKRNNKTALYKRIAEEINTMETSLELITAGDLNVWAGIKESDRISGNREILIELYE